MPRSAKRPVAPAWILTSFCVGALLFPSAERAFAALFAQRPGPIDRPLFLLAADFDRDGFSDLAIADFQAGVIQILINQHDGTFAPHVDSPVSAGAATFNSPTAGPLHMAVGTLNPEDVDSDGVPNATDSCPNIYNPVDSTGTQPNVCDDKHPLMNCIGGCPNDCDCDGIPDFDSITKKPVDNCPRAYNPNQEAETAKGGDGICGTPDDLRSLYGPDGLCGTGDDLTDPSVGQACAGSPDLVVADANFGAGFLNGIVRVRINDGTGQLIARSPYATGIGPAQVLLDDFNGNDGRGDGRFDMVTSNSGSNDVQVQFGLTNGLFSPAQILTTGAGPEGLASGDFNGDGRRDLAVANRTDGTIGVYFNKPQGLPSSATLTINAGSEPTDLLAGRLNADLLDDLVVLDQGPSGTGAIEIFLGSPTGTLTPGSFCPLPTTGSRPRGGALADLDGDSILDLAVDDFEGGQVFIYKGLGNGSFSCTPTTTLTGMTNPAAIVAFDYDPNGPGGPALDLAVLDFAKNRVNLFHNEGGLTFIPALTSPVVSAWTGSSAMSFFGADALVSNDITLLHRSPPRIDVLSGIGNGAFRPTFPIPLKGPKTADGMLLSDLRQDNFPDLLVLDQTNNQVTVVTGDPSGVMVERESYPVPAGTASTAYGSILSSTNDYDGDGVPDILDDCPTTYNPPGCRVRLPMSSQGDPACALVGTFCTDPSLMPIDCGTKDPVTGQCDSDGNGIGDQCQILGSTCAALNPSPIDTDGDLVFDYNPNAFKILATGVIDFDNDGVADDADNCPTVANADQKDANNNGVGDACETPSANCGGLVDCDGDGVIDFDPNFKTKLSPFCQANLTDPTCHNAVMVAALDNCPTIYNPGQEDNDGDHVGNACIIRAALDNCPFVPNKDQADTGLLNGTTPAGRPGNGVGDACDSPPNYVVAVTPGSSSLTIFEGDGSGKLHPATFSPLQASLNNPSSVLVGSFSLICAGNLCSAKPTNDILVAERGVVPNSSDDDLRVLAGDGSGFFTFGGTAPAQGDPSALMNIPAQSVCANQYLTSTPDAGLRFDFSGNSNLVVALEPGTSTLGIFLVSNRGLVPPVAHPAPLPVPGILLDAAFNDVNRDGIEDLVALSRSPGSPPVSYVTVYIGMGNGLFYTDPTVNPLPIAGDAAFLEIGVAHLQSTTLPDIMIFMRDDEAPIVLSNILHERADIDGSGRIDGYDLAILARSFGSRRGLDFVLQSDGTLQQDGSGYTSLIHGSGTETAGQNDLVPSPICIPNSTRPYFQSTSGAYGIPVDINLDGQVDGTDLALLAAFFGRSP